MVCNTPVKSPQAADGDANRQYPEADVVAGKLAPAQQSYEDGAQRDGSLDRKIDAAYHDRQVKADGQDRGNCRQTAYNLNVCQRKVLSLGANGENDDNHRQGGDLRQGSRAAQPTLRDLACDSRRGFLYQRSVSDAF